MYDSVAYDRGVHLRATPVWFDAELRRELCVLTGLQNRLPVGHRRTIASAPLALALERAGYASSILPSPWGRWLGVGGQRLQLIDAGAEPGGAAAWIEGPDEQVLVTGLLRHTNVHWPRADHVVVRAPALRHVGLPLGEVALSLAVAAQDRLRQGGQPRIWVDSVEAAWALHGAMATLGAPPQPRGLLARVISPHVGSLAGPGSRASLGVLPRGGVVAGPDTLAVDTGLGLLSDFAQKFALAWFANHATLRAVATASRAKRFSLIGVPEIEQPEVTKVLGTSVSVRFLRPARQLLLDTSSVSRAAGL